jgi:hypothetical protein
MVLQGVDPGFHSVPLHCINSKLFFASGQAVVGIRSMLPVEDSSLLLTHAHWWFIVGVYHDYHLLLSQDCEVIRFWSVCCAYEDNIASRNGDTLGVENLFIRHLSLSSKAIKSNTQNLCISPFKATRITLKPG